MADDYQPRHDDVRFEQTDVEVGPIVAFLVTLSTIIAVLMILLWWFQAVEMRSQDERTRPGNLLAAQQAQRPEAERRPPQPRIEGIGAPSHEASHSVTDPTIPLSVQS